MKQFINVYKSGYNAIYEQMTWPWDNNGHEQSILDERRHAIRNHVWTKEHYTLCDIIWVCWDKHIIHVHYHHPLMLSMTNAIQRHCKMQRNTFGYNTAYSLLRFGLECMHNKVYWVYHNSVTLIKWYTLLHWAIRMIEY